MMSETVMESYIAEYRNDCKSRIADCVIYPEGRLGQRNSMLTTRELLERLEQRGIKNHQIAKALGVSPSRVTEMHKGERAIKLDEAARLVSAFGLEEPPTPAKMSPLPAPIARLVVVYVGAELGLATVDPLRVEEIARDVRAFAEFVTDPAVRGSIDAAETFFQAMRLRRSVPESAAPPGTDSQPVK
jgi:transcriptional regulator with XRE-family HTH domain